MIHAVPYDKCVGARKPHKIGTLRGGARPVGFLKQYAQHYFFRLTGEQMLPGKGQRSPAVEDVIDEQDASSGDVDFRIPQQANRT
jgi:hypothetical protein